MSFKSLKHPLSKNEDTKAVDHFEEKIITKGMTYKQTTTKSISLFNAYGHLNPPPPQYIVQFSIVTQSKCFNNYSIAMLSILGLKFQIKL